MGVKEKTGNLQVQVRDSFRKAQYAALGPRRARHTDTHSNFTLPEGMLFLLSSSKAIAWTTARGSEGQVLRVKQRENPVLAEKRFSAAHLAED